MIASQGNSDNAKQGVIAALNDELGALQSQLASIRGRLLNITRGDRSLNGDSGDSEKDFDLLIEEFDATQARISSLVKGD